MARRGRFVARNFHKRGTFWGRSPADTGPTAIAASTALLDSTSVPVVEGETVIRARGYIAVANDQSAALENATGAVGICIATDQAVAVGVGSIPTPYTDQDSDLWLMHQYWSVRNMVESSTNEYALGYQIFHFDSKAMRKNPTGTTVCIVVENGSSTGGAVYHLCFSILFKVN